MSELENPLFDKGLPKWPQLYTTGKKVELDQAKEIIRRTDYFLISGNGGNDHAWDKRMAQRFRMPHYHDYLRDPKEPIDWKKNWAMAQKWRELWGVVNTNYIHNSWLSCAFIYGPHGWCYPDGAISYTDNVGKYPDVKDVYEDWVTLAREFPFLDLASTLMSGENCEDGAEPVVTFLVKNGEVQIVEGARSHHEPYPFARGHDFDTAIKSIAYLHPNAREHASIREEWYEEWEKKAIEITPLVEAAEVES
jgi:hypothetical protein